MIKFVVLLYATLLVLYTTLPRAIKITFWCIAPCDVEALCLQEHLGLKNFNFQSSLKGQSAKLANSPLISVIIM